MKVKELLQKLANLDGDMEVTINGRPVVATMQGPDNYDLMSKSIMNQIYNLDPETI